MRHVLRPVAGYWTDPVTKSADRKYSLFKVTWEDTVALLYDEVEWLGGKGPVVIQADLSERDIRLDGTLRANAAPGAFPGVIVSFDSAWGPLRYATDTYIQGVSRKMKSWQHNVRAIALSLTALRAVDRYGVSKRGQQYTGWKALPSGGQVTFPSADEALRWMREMAGPRAEGRNASELWRLLGRAWHPDANDGKILPDWERLQAAKLLLTTARMM